MNNKNSMGGPAPFTPAERLLEDILALPDDALDDCLDPYEAVQYAKGELDLDSGSAIERHRESCESCAKFLDGIVYGLRELEKERRLLPWLALQLQQLGAPLRKQASNLMHATKFGRNIVRRTLRLPLALPHQFRPVFDAQAFDAVAPLVEASTPDRRLRWRIVDEGLEVVVTFDSDVDELVGMPAIRLLFGEAVESVVFAKCAGRIVGTAVFSKVQLGSWCPTDVLQLEVEGLDEDSSATESNGLRGGGAAADQG